MRPADAAKRVGMTEADFRSVNAIPPRVVIRAGSSLLVPRSEQTSHDVAVQVADNGQLSLAPEVVLKQMVVKAGKAESVASIARRYRLNAAQVAQWNKMAVTESFKPGQSILLYFPPKAYPKSNTASQGKPRAKAAAAPGKRKPATPVVKR
jgi:membrane-bound lytic murein transglycosylase D